MAIFTIGDLHLSLGTSKPMDIFSGWENYVERLRENWLAAVGPQDTVVLAGDKMCIRDSPVLEHRALRTLNHAKPQQMRFC